MAKNKKEAPEETNAIENLNEQLTSAGQALMEKRKLFYWFVGGVVGIGAIILCWVFFYRNPEMHKASEAYGKALTEHGMTAPNDTLAAEAFKKVYNEYSSTPMGKNAALRSAESYYRIGKYQEALDMLNKFSTSEPVLNALAEMMKGDCAVNLNKFGEAHTYFTKALKIADGNPAVSALILSKDAKVYAEEKNFTKAMEIYQSIQKDYPEEAVDGLPAEFWVNYYKAKAGK